jgi:hypothetical protein
VQRRVRSTGHPRSEGASLDTRPVVGEEGGGEEGEVVNLAERRDVFGSEEGDGWRGHPEGIGRRMREFRADWRGIKGGKPDQTRRREEKQQRTLIPYHSCRSVSIGSEYGCSTSPTSRVGC